MLRALFLALSPLAFALFAAEESRAAVSVTLEGDSTMTVSAVGWKSTDFVMVVFPDGTEKYIGMQKIKAIVDEEGKDRTKDVLDNRKAVGTPPPGYEGELGHGSFGIGKILLVGVIAATVTLLAIAGDLGSGLY